MCSLCRPKFYQIRNRQQSALDKVHEVCVPNVCQLHTSILRNEFLQYLRLSDFVFVHFLFFSSKIFYRRKDIGNFANFVRAPIHSKNGLLGLLIGD